MENEIKNESKQVKKDRLSTIKKKEIFLQALEKSLGILAPAMQQANIGCRQTIIEWKEKDPEFKKRFDEVECKTGDFVENALLKKIKDGDTTAIIFYCKTKLKKRGYVEKLDINATHNVPDDSTLESIERKIASLRKVENGN